MAKGGARYRSGPPAEQNAIRRERDGKEWIHLAAGREGPAPEWPLTRPTARERTLWEQTWHRPQAAMWEANGQQVEVAIYVRTLRDAERARATVAARSELRRQMDALGLTIAGMRAHRWLIDEEPAGDEQQPASSAGRPADPRSRFRSIEGGAAGAA